MCKKYLVEGFTSKKLSVFAEHMDTIEYLMDSRVKETLNELGHLIETLELSDCFNNVLHQGNNLKMTLYLNKLKI